MTIPAEKIFNEIQTLSNENPDSVLNFEEQKKWPLSYWSSRESM